MWDSRTRLSNNSNLEFQFHSVIRKLHVLRQIRIGFFVRQVMTDVSEKSAPRFQSFYCLQRVLYRGVCRMRLVAQRVEEEHIQSLQLGQRAFGNRAVVSQISCRSKTKTIDLRLTMNQHYRLESRSEQLQWPINRLQLNMWQSAEFIVGVKNISKHIADKVRRVRVRIQRQSVGFVQETQRSQIIDP